MKSVQDTDKLSLPSGSLETLKEVGEGGEFRAIKKQLCHGMTHSIDIQDVREHLKGTSSQRTNRRKNSWGQDTWHIVEVKVVQCGWATVSQAKEVVKNQIVKLV